MKGQQEERLARRLRDALRAGEPADAVTRARLAAARARALDRTRPAIGWPWAGAALAVSLLAAVLVLRPGAPAPAPAPGELLEALLEEDPVLEAELYEDLDVLTWLAAADDHA